jgi:DNA-binding NarL/FixJ family response regulator
MSDRLPTVVIVDDHALFRAGVRAELEGLVDVRAEAETVEAAVAATLAEKPDVVLLDVHMPGGGGIEVIRQVGRRQPGQRFLALSVSDAPEDVIAVIRAGSRGYVTKSISGPELADAIDRVRGGDAVFSPRLAGFALDAFQGEIAEADVDPELDQLTMREREVLRLIARGYLYKEVALQLGISPKTVEAHVSAVLRKLQLSNRHELSRWAVERRLVEWAPAAAGTIAAGWRHRPAGGRLEPMAFVSRGFSGTAPQPWGARRSAAAGPVRRARSTRILLGQAPSTCGGGCSHSARRSCFSRKAEARATPAARRLRGLRLALGTAEGK